MQTVWHHFLVVLFNSLFSISTSYISYNLKKFLKLYGRRSVLLSLLLSFLCSPSLSLFILLFFFLSANIYLTCFRVQIKLKFPLFPFFLTVYSDQTADIGWKKRNSKTFFFIGFNDWRTECWLKTAAMYNISGIKLLQRAHNFVTTLSTLLHSKILLLGNIFRCWCSH